MLLHGIQLFTFCGELERERESEGGVGERREEREREQVVLEDEIKEGIQEHKHPIYTLIITPLEASKRMPHANNSPSLGQSSC